VKIPFFRREPQNQATWDSPQTVMQMTWLENKIIAPVNNAV